MFKIIIRTSIFREISIVIVTEITKLRSCAGAHDFREREYAYMQEKYTHANCPFFLPNKLNEKKMNSVSKRSSYIMNDKTFVSHCTQIETSLCNISCPRQINSLKKRPFRV